MAVVDVQLMVHHKTRADAFLDGMKLLADDLAGYGQAVALLAVHGSISMTDAVRICYTGKRGRDPDHADAVRALRLICSKRKVNTDGVKHLSWLIARKTDFAYGDRRVDRLDVEHAKVHAERFSVWVEQHFVEVTRKGAERD